MLLHSQTTLTFFFPSVPPRLILWFCFDTHIHIVCVRVLRELDFIDWSVLYSLFRYHRTGDVWHFAFMQCFDFDTGSTVQSVITLAILITSGDDLLGDWMFENFKLELSLRLLMIKSCYENITHRVFERLYVHPIFPLHNFLLCLFNFGTWYESQLYQFFTAPPLFLGALDLTHLMQPMLAWFWRVRHSNPFSISTFSHLFFVFWCFGFFKRIRFIKNREKDC